MASSRQALENALRAYQTKLQDLTMDDAFRAADQGVRLVIVAQVSRAFDTRGDELLFEDDQQRVWGCQASCERLLAWLTDDGIIAICRDQLPDVRVSGR